VERKRIHDAAKAETCNRREILPMCDMAVLYDNTDSFQGFAIYQDGILVKINDNKIPKWYSRIIGS